MQPPGLRNVVESWVFNFQVGLENSLTIAGSCSGDVFFGHMPCHWRFMVFHHGSAWDCCIAGSKKSSSVCSRWVELRPKKARFENPNGQHRTVSETSLTSFTV